MINTVKGKALEVAEYLTPVLKVSGAEPASGSGLFAARSRCAPEAQGSRQAGAVPAAVLRGRLAPLGGRGATLPCALPCPPSRVSMGLAGGRSPSGCHNGKPDIGSLGNLGSLGFAIIF